MIKTIFPILLIVVLTSCTARPQVLPPPEDYSKIIKEVENSTALNADPKLKQTIVKSLKDQSDYSTSCYVKLNEFDARLKKIESDNQALKDENEKLKSELSHYHRIEFWFWTVVISLIVIAVISFLWPIIKLFAERLIGIPL